MAIEMKRGLAIAGRVFGVERKMSAAGKKYQVGSIGVSKKGKDGEWENGFLRFTLFGDTPIESKQDYTLAGQLQPSKYTKKDGTAVDTFEMVAYEVGAMTPFEAKADAPVAKANDGWGDTPSKPEPIDSEEIPF